MHHTPDISKITIFSYGDKNKFVAKLIHDLAQKITQKAVLLSSIIIAFYISNYIQIIFIITATYLKHYMYIKLQIKKD